MATTMILRRQYSLTSTATRHALAALTSIIHSNQPLSLSSASTIRNSHFMGSNNESTTVFKSCFEEQRNMNSRSASLYSRASFASQAAGYDVADYSDEDKTRGGGGGDEGLEISKLNLHPDVVSCLSNRGITKLFPIQRAVLEPAMQGRDMIGRAKTGTGKTLAFGIPIMDKITRHNSVNGAGRDPLALVLAPTRELARQVEKEFYESSKLDTLCVYGGTPIGAQMRALSRGVDVVAGTPGRVIDLIKRGALDLSQVQYVVLDEADQMLAIGFEEDVEVILQKLPQQRQTLMFSATMPKAILNLTRKYLKNPMMIDLVGDSDQKLAEGISLYSVSVEQRSKAGVIGPLITEYSNGGKSIVFTQTKRDADSLASALARKNYKCEALHGDISQNQRERTLQRFRNGDINILVATDVAARGLDIPNVDLIIHYELPTTSEQFVHRSGRTGRAGKKGTAITIYSPDQERAVKIIERDVGCRFKELPPVASDGTEMDMSMGGGGRFGNSGFNRFGGQGNYSSGRYGNMNSGGSNGGFSRSGDSYGRGGASRSGGGFNGSRGSDDFGWAGFGQQRGGGGFADPGKTNKSGGFSNFGSGGSNRRSGGFGNSNSSRFGGFGDDKY